MKVALIQFKEVGKKYFFSIPDNLTLAIKDLVVVETVEGLEMGEVTALKDEEDVEITSVLKPVLRVANENDHKMALENQALEAEILNFTIETCDNLNLDMNVLDAEYTLDRNKATIFFEAEGRVDFRELLKVLNSTYYQTRIELRQIGSRDVAKKIGGLGPCGLVLCCSTFIGDFEPVTIKMAKNQNIALNPKKISGLCGKLLCCLKYEDESYTELKKAMPDLYSKLSTEKGDGKVIDINLFKRKVKVRYSDNELADEWIEYRD